MRNRDVCAACGVLVGLRVRFDPSIGCEASVRQMCVEPRLLISTSDGYILFGLLGHLPWRDQQRLVDGAVPGDIPRRFGRRHADAGAKRPQRIVLQVRPELGSTPPSLMMLSIS